MTIIPKQPGFYPFYDPYRGSDTLNYPRKIGVAVGLGSFYVLAQYYSLPDKLAFFRQYCWILGIIISTSMMALYISTDVFRHSLKVMDEFEGDSDIRNQIVATWFSDKWYLLTGLGLGTVNVTVSHLLGIPADFHATVFSLVTIYFGVFLSGFTAGMGLHGIISIIVLYLRFAPNLRHSLNPNDPDGSGGIKKLGDALWFFGMLIGAVAVLVSIYMFGVQWAFVYKPYVQVIFLSWLAFPYIVAISVVLIPGLAVRRQVSYYKKDMASTLKQEEAKIYASYKRFDEKEDEIIITEKKELNKELDRIQDDLKKLKSMRNSHIDGKN